MVNVKQQIYEKQWQGGEAYFRSQLKRKRHILVDKILSRTLWAQTWIQIVGPTLSEMHVHL